MPPDDGLRTLCRFLACLRGIETETICLNRDGVVGFLACLRGIETIVRSSGVQPPLIVFSLPKRN